MFAEKTHAGYLEYVNRCKIVHIIAGGDRAFPHLREAKTSIPRRCWPHAARIAVKIVNFAPPHVSYLCNLLLAGRAKSRAASLCLSYSSPTARARWQFPIVN